MAASSHILRGAVEERRDPEGPLELGIWSPAAACHPCGIQSPCLLGAPVAMVVGKAPLLHWTPVHVLGGEEPECLGS